MQQPDRIGRKVRRQAVQRLLRHPEQLAPGGVARHFRIGGKIGHRCSSAARPSAVAGRPSQARMLRRRRDMLATPPLHFRHSRC
ncbi:hypothetical protein ACFQU2_23710 [Siccirubricoccus deserti]